MTKNEHNGWYNYETWVVALWMDNEPGQADYWRERTAQLMDNATHSHARGELGTFTIDERSALNLADVLKEHHEESLPQLIGFACDLLNGALSEVNWMEIAKHQIDAVKSDSMA